MEKLKMHSVNKVNENVKKIGELFPNCLTERIGEDGKIEACIDFDVLKQELSSVVVEGNEERYQFTWPDKKKAILLANAPISATLRPCREESVDFDKTQNLYIEGDNLDVLKLLQETYLGKIKMIYIDPPYNTGNDFVYEDDFAEDADEYLANSGQFDDQGNRLVQNTESNGRFHTDWLNMIYPRLKLAKDLMSDDGVIFISIDDNEVDNLRKICDEIFGELSFIAEFPRVTKKGGKSTDTYAKNHDYVLCYCKNYEYIRISGIAHFDPGFKYKDEFYEERGPFKLNQTLDYNTLQYNTSMDYIITIDGVDYVPGSDVELQKQRHSGNHAKHDWVWRWSPALVDFGLKNGWIVVSKTGRIYTKTYLNATIDKKPNGEYQIVYSNRTKPVTTLDFVENEYSNDNSIKEIVSLMGSSLFDYVKPTSLVEMIMKTVTKDEDIVMDFFSGSGTTAHSVLKLNANEQGKRKFIMVQLPEKCLEGTDAYRAGFKTICEIGKERIRRAGAKIKEENPMTAADLDVGFRVLKLDTSNIKDVSVVPGDVDFDFTKLADNIKEDRTPEDLLFQVMLDLGVELSASIREETICGKKVFYVAEELDNFLIACFDKDVTDDVITEIAKKKPYYFVTRDASMATDSVATNFDQIFETYSPTTVRKVL